MTYEPTVKALNSLEGIIGIGYRMTGNARMESTSHRIVRWGERKRGYEFKMSSPMDERKVELQCTVYNWRGPASSVSLDFTVEEGLIHNAKTTVIWRDGDQFSMGPEEEALTVEAYLGKVADILNKPESIKAFEKSIVKARKAIWDSLSI